MSCRCTNSDVPTLDRVPQAPQTISRLREGVQSAKGARNVGVNHDSLSRGGANGPLARGNTARIANRGE